MIERVPVQDEIDPRIAIVLDGLTINQEMELDGRPLSADRLAACLAWDEELNMAVLPAGVEQGTGESKYQALVAHSTLSHDDLMVPQLCFDARPQEYQTRVGNVYGTGFYVANRREAALRRGQMSQGREIGAFLTAPFNKREVMDSRRRLTQEVLHLGGMVATEIVLPKLLGVRRVARTIANHADAKMETNGARLRLLNEAPRGRAEKLAYEDDWQYGLVPPQYVLARLSMARIGTYDWPNKAPAQHSALTMYTQKFWQAAVRNARSMRLLNAPRKSFTSKG